MIKLIIDKIDGYDYYLKEDTGLIHKLNIEFYDLINKPKVNDNIFISEELLNEYDVLSFGPLDGKYGKEIKDNDDTDLIILVTNSDKIYLKRYYG